MPDGARREMWRYVVKLAIAIVFWLALFVILKCAGRGSWWHFLPVYICPLCGLYWVGAWAWELRSEALRPSGMTRYTGFTVLFYMPVAYGILVLLFGFAYAAANKLGIGQVLCVKESYECVWRFVDLVYYSVVTASTLGYGDLIPVGWARLLACIEVVEFWMFLVVAFFYFERAVKPT